MKIVIWGGKSSVLKPHCVYGSAGASPLNEISDGKPDDLPTDMTIFRK